MKTALRGIYYRLKYQYLLRKAYFGKGTQIKCKLDIRGPGTITIGENCIIDCDPWGNDYVTIYTHRPKSKITIGNRVVLRATRFGSHKSITVQDNAIIENASIFDSDFHNLDAAKRDEGFNDGDREVIIGAGSYIGCEGLCSKGTNLKENVVVYPRCLIGTKIVPKNKVIFGNPGRVKV